MASSKEVLHRAEARLEQARRQNELDCERRISAIYEKLPRLAEIDRELRKTSAKVYAAAFRESESPEQAMQKLKEENLSLQRERDWILESENIFVMASSCKFRLSIMILSCAPSDGILSACPRNNAFLLSRIL